MPDIIQKLFDTISSRKGASPETSYTAKLLHEGPNKIAEKVIEEAGEAAVEIRAGDKQKLASESADVIYHLMVGWAATGITPQDVAAVLEKRHGISGIDEKNSRAK
jgi:phosphoribosyl-ATP pyrophosphohydrolase